MFRKAEAGDLLTPEADGRMLARVLAAVDRRQRHQSRWSRRWLAAASLAAAVVLLGFSAWFMLFQDDGASKAYAGMIRELAQVSSVSYRQTVHVPGKIDSGCSVLVAYPNRIRLDGDDGITTITDMSDGKKLRLSRGNKEAGYRLVSATPWANPIDQLRDAGDSAGKLIGTEDWHGRKILVYEVPAGGMRVWLDALARLPVQIEITDGSGSITRLEDFHWNDPVAPEAISMEVPAGYKLATPQTEQDVLTMLRTITDLEDGRYPAELGYGSMFGLLRTHFPADVVFADHDTAVQTIDFQGEAKERSRQMAQGIIYLNNIKIAGGDWGYLGAGRTTADDSAIVLWYRQAGSSRIRAFYGDLMVVDLNEDALSAHAGSTTREQPATSQ